MSNEVIKEQAKEEIKIVPVKQRRFYPTAEEKKANQIAGARVYIKVLARQYAERQVRYRF